MRAECPFCARVFELNETQARWQQANPRLEIEHICSDCTPFDEDEKCHLCHGTGEINALTGQDYMFVASYADCPVCDGSGEAP